VARLARPRGGPATRGGARLSTGALRSERLGTDERFFGAEGERIARLCHGMAERFARGGRLLAVARSPRGWSDAHHVAVEFVHPVIVGKRALPALALAPEQLVGLAEPDDMVIAFDPSEDLSAASGRGAMTIAFCPDTAADWVFVPPTSNPFVAQELVETLYHFLWEHVHVFLEHSGGQSRGGGASSFLYPFLEEQKADPEVVIQDVHASVLMKAREIAELRAQTLEENRDELAAAAAGLRSGRLLALGNGGSATDAMDVVADFHPRPAIDLSADSAIITAIANDIGTEAIFARQVIAYGRPGDTLLALSTSGNSDNVIAALAQARRQGMRTVAMVGYDGGRVAADQLADHVIVTRSEHIPRIQEAQASAYHLLLELVAG
jgi:D-sedoheptulose 7-phosphate isomerase